MSKVRVTIHLGWDKSYYRTCRNLAAAERQADRWCKRWRPSQIVAIIFRPVEGRA